MKDRLLSLTVKMQVLLNEEGQDLIEYVLAVALVALVATAGMSSLATAINSAFAGVGSTLSSYVN
jgi:Flp pilus assembly pilin Flp